MHLTTLENQCSVFSVKDRVQEELLCLVVELESNAETDDDLDVLINSKCTCSGHQRGFEEVNSLHGVVVTFFCSDFLSCEQIEIRSKRGAAALPSMA